MISWILNKLSRCAPRHQKGLFLGTAVRGQKPLVLDDSTLRSHVMLSGRRGQGCSQLLPQMLTQQTVDGRGWVHIDSTDDNTWRDQIAAVAREAGRMDEFYVLDLVEPNNSNTYDVLRAGAAEERSRRVLTLFPEAKGPGSEFYRKTVGDFITKVFEALDALGVSAGLYEMAELLSHLGQPTFREQVMALVPAGHPAGATLAAAQDALEIDHAEVRRLVMMNGRAADRLELLSRLPSSSVFNQPQSEIDFADILASGKMCLVRIPYIEQDTEMASVAKMILQDIFSALSTRAREPEHQRPPFLVAMDGFPAYGLSKAVTAPLTSATWAHARGVNVSLVPVVNSANWDQVHAEYSTETLAGNTHTKVYFQQEDSEHLAEQHADLSAGVLPSLQPGHFVMHQGDSVVAGKLPYTATGASPEFKKQPMPGLVALPRLTLPTVHIHYE